MKIDKNDKRIINILIKESEANYKTIIKKVSKETHIDEKWLELELRDALFALKYLPIQFQKIIKKEKVEVPKYKKEGFIEYMPKGRILQILPSSTPILSNVLLPFCASLSGNRVIVKPSSKTQYIGRFIQKVFDNNGYEKIVFRIRGRKKFPYSLIKNINFVFYMGSKKIGKEIELYCCKKDIEFLGEFEGNDWVIVLDGDAKRISEQIVRNVLFKDGKDCDSIKGVLVKRKLYSKIKSNLMKKIGDILNDRPSEKDITNPDFYSSLWIKKINTLNEAIELTKLNKHGLSISIFDKNYKRALDLARKLNFARVVINSDTLDINPLIPWGGIKKTSSGGVEYWIKKFVNKKLIEVKK
jgi:acyl-CoA reductase-like NAD-dependent aldehyde dehydrogenase